MNAREFAIGALVRVERGAYSNIVVPESLRTSGLSARDRAFATDLVYGTLREQRRLDALVAPFAQRPSADLDPPVRAALRSGTYQLVHGVAVHAAVGETVAATPARARGFVNAVLRRVSEAGPPWPEPEELAVRLSYPDWIVDELAGLLTPAEVDAVLAAGNVPAALTLRPNPLVTDTDRLAAELESTGVSVARGGLVPGALVVRGTGDPAALPAIAQGRATPQDQGSQAVVDVLDPRAGERVLDVCAAPGAKSTAVAERIGATGLVVAADVDPGRLRLVTEATGRLHLANVETVVADAHRLPVAAAGFDAVLVDAPCSGLGVLRRRPEARWRTSPDAIAGLASVQRELLWEAAAAVRPGGRLVYAVCTLTRAETVDVATWAIHALPGFDVLPPPAPPWRPCGPGGLVLPHDAGTDGMFVLTLERRSGAAG